jgi:hypothetical protein
MKHGLVLMVVSGSALAGPTPSSHREAPFVTETPKVDATDFYMFNSYEAGRDGYVTLIANYIPFQTPYGGPNFFSLDPDALYQIHIDNDGDGKEDVTFTFKFRTNERDITLNIGGVNVPVPLYNVGTIGPLAGNTANLNVLETYSLTVSYGDQYFGQTCEVRNAQTGDTTFKKPADSVGAKTFPNGYENYARTHIFPISLPGCSQQGRVFVGQRKDPFVANLGEIFDLVNTNPLGPPNAKPNTLDDDNVTSLILEVPRSFLTHGSEKVIGGWTTASLPSTRVLRQHPNFNQPALEYGPFLQVSRLGMPLVNELVIGLRDKNKFNASRPRHDGQFLTYVTNPTFPAILNVLFGVTAPCTPRNDLVAAFLTGVDGLNKPAHVVPSEMLRLNTNTDPAHGGIAVKPKGQQNYLGVVGGDLAGFPNGRRPGDDVVDITIRAAMGVLVPGAGSPTGCSPSGLLPYTDGAQCTDQLFDAAFPYLKTPVTTSPAH